MSCDSILDFIDLVLELLDLNSYKEFYPLQKIETTPNILIF